MNFEFLSELNKGALLTAVKENGDINTMTVSWGGVGVLWGKRVGFVFVRPQRHTFLFTQNGTKMSLSFLKEEKESALSYCGTKSGRDVNKFKECGLEYSLKNGYPILKDAGVTLILEKIYADDIKKECFIDTDSLKWYKNDDYHKMYICEIKEII